MKNIENNKTIVIITALSLILGLASIVFAFFTDDTNAISNKQTLYQIGGLLMALAVILFILALQIKRRQKNKKNRYHAVHWNDGHITKD